MAYESIRPEAPCLKNADLGEARHKRYIDASWKAVMSSRA